MLLLLWGGGLKTSDAGLRETTFLIKKIFLVLFAVLSLGPFESLSLGPADVGKQSLTEQELTYNGYDGILMMGWNTKN